MEGLQRRVETWIKDQGWKMPKLQLPAMPQMRWVGVRWPPWSSDREHRKKLQEEYERRRKQLQDLCRAVKAESVSDLQEILCCMVLSECVYKVVFLLFCLIWFHFSCFGCNAKFLNQWYVSSE